MPTSSRRSDVVLVSMPWATALQPSLQLGILAGRLVRAGISTRTMYPNLRFAKEIGLTEYERYGTYDSFFSQWVFAETLFGKFDVPPSVGPADFCDFAQQAGVSSRQLEELRRVKAIIPAFIDECLAELEWEHVKIVGFTTTLLQTLPALALARVLAEAHPHLCILFGGAGCHGVMGETIFEDFEFVDGVVDGEGDEVIVPLVRAVLEGRKPAPRPGLRFRGVEDTGAPPIAVDLADYPTPAYADYFAEVERCFGRSPSDVVRVPFEASRGCWWALRRQCKFCGLNGEALAQRPRDLDAVVSELELFHREYGASFFFATDNIIAPTHVTHLPKKLLERLPPVELFFETRVVAQRAHLEELAGAGIVHMQAGVESLIPEVLDKTDKGTTPASNVCFLRRAIELGIRPYWNLLYGFAGDEHDWYVALVELLPRLHHLRAPDVIQFSLQRFSPYFNEPESYGISNVRPMPGSYYVWNIPPEHLRDISFDLAFDCPGSEDFPATGAILREAVAQWASVDAELTASSRSGGAIEVRDTRSAFGGTYTVPPANAMILRALEKPRSVAQLTERLRSHDVARSVARRSDAIAEGLQWLDERGLVFEDRGRYVGLVVPDEGGFWFDDRSPSAAEIRTAPSSNIFLPVI